MAAIPNPNHRNSTPFDHALHQTQAGLLFNPRHGIFLTLVLKDHSEASRAKLMKFIRVLDTLSRGMTPRTTFVIGFSATLWQAWTKQPAPGHRRGESILQRSEHFRDTGGDVWLYLKSEDRAAVEKLLAISLAQLENVIEDQHHTQAYRRDDHRVFGQHFIDGLVNPASPEGVLGAIIRTGSGNDAGSLWALSQKFELNWRDFEQLGLDAQEDMIGRDTQGAIIPDDDLRSHIRKARVHDHQRRNKPLLRQALPYGQSATARGREQGIYFAAFASELATFEDILQRMAGDNEDAAPDHLLNNVQALAGAYWYIPNNRELGLDKGLTSADFVTEPYWRVRSDNGYMFYNSNDYLNRMSTGQYKPGDPPSSRILYLLKNTFALWRDHWYQQRTIPRIPHLSEFLQEDEKHLMQEPVPIRKGLAIKKSLSLVHTNPHYPQTKEMYAWQADQFRVDAKDILFGVMPELSLGRGKEVMPYLREDEEYSSFLMMLDESSAMGHVVPDHERMLRNGLDRLLLNLKQRLQAVEDDEQQYFFQSSIYALEGVQAWFMNYANLAQHLAAELNDEHSIDRTNLQQLAQRAKKLAHQAPETLVEAVQMIFAVHCCLHLTGTPVAVGRLDQLLIPFYEQDQLSEAAAQEIIDALWVKLGEKAIHNRHMAGDHVSYGTTAVAYTGGNFPQGGGINQWVQQITVGGYLPTDSITPSPGANAITLMALRASRRLPLNAPCLSLRMYPGMPRQLIEESAKALLSGGAHPILFNEDRIIYGLHKYSGFPLKAARDYACDGCYEPMIAGQTEFAFSNVAPLDALELSLNQGAKYNQAGSVYLRGWKVTYRSPHAKQIHSFEQLQEIYLKHLEWLVVQFFNEVLVNYGNLWQVCPSPLLSILIQGCMESGRDLTNGGANYHIIAPMFVGMATTIDSLYAIKKMVFDDRTAITTLPELLDCLKSDWGFDPREPWQSQLAGDTRAQAKAARFKALRDVALNLPKFGMGDDEVDTLGAWLSEQMCDMAQRIIAHPPSPLKETLHSLTTRYSRPGRDWKLHVCPGIGTFEGYVGDGQGSGASADGRRNAQPYPSDFSPAPLPQDLPLVAAQPAPKKNNSITNRPIYTALSSWNQPQIYHKITNAAPVDLNIHEDFPLADLVAFIQCYVRGQVGSNLVTITCANPNTYQQAETQPERYELVRVRMGGWSEFFAAMFPAHQQQHERRPYFVPENNQCE